MIDRYGCLYQVQTFWLYSTQKDTVRPLEVLVEEIKAPLCGVEITLNLVGGKWKGLILWHLCQKTLRFSQLRRRTTGVTQKMLTQQLRELERDGLVYREVYPEVPPKVEYSLTDEGRSLEPLLQLMCKWGQKYSAEVACR